MKRKDFFKRFIFGATGILLLGGSAKKETPGIQRIKLLTFFVAGFQYYDGMEIEHLLKKGMPLLLNRQPHNRYDKNAIEVFSGEAKLGFIPRTDNKVIADIMDQGVEVLGEIIELNPDADPFGNVKAEVWYEREFLNDIYK